MSLCRVLDHTYTLYSCTLLSPFLLLICDRYPSLIFLCDYDWSQLASLRLHPNCNPRLPPHRATLNHLSRSLLPCQRLPLVAISWRLCNNRGSLLLARVFAAKFLPPTSTFPSKATVDANTYRDARMQSTHHACLVPNVRRSSTNVQTR